MDWAQMFQMVLSHGLVGGVVCMAAFIFALHREWVVMGSHFRAAVKDKDEYKKLLRTAEDSAKDTRQSLAELTRKLEARK